jgi:hypothetical protein
MAQSRPPIVISKDIDNQQKEIINQEDNLNQLQVKINKLRETYMGLVNEYYIAEPPFPSNRDHSEFEFENDLKKIKEIIKHCLISGNDNLLKEWLLKPLREKKFYILAMSNKISDYNLAIGRLIETSSVDKEKKYLSQIKEVLSKN